MTLCPVCGRPTRVQSSPYTNAGPHRHKLFKGLELRRCTRCDSMWCPEAPSDAELGRYYATDYTPARMGAFEKDRWPIWDSRPVSLITLARMYTEWTPGDTFIDVGPGNGAALSLAPLLLRDAALGCVEFNERSITHFRRHAPEIVIRQALDEFAERSARIVYSAHSLEHYRADEVLDALRDVRRVLVDGGVLALEVPFAPSARTLAANRHTPHLLFFSEAGICQLLSRAGLQVAFSCTALGRQFNDAISARQDVGDALGPRLAQRLAALNTGDLVGCTPVEGEPIRGVLKVIAVNQGRPDAIVRARGVARSVIDRLRTVARQSP